MCDITLEYSSNPVNAPCPSCIMDLVPYFEGDYKEEFTCYCCEVFEPHAPGFPEMINGEKDYQYEI